MWIALPLRAEDAHPPMLDDLRTTSAVIRSCRTSSAFTCSITRSPKSPACRSSNLTDTPMADARFACEGV